MLTDAKWGGPDGGTRCNLGVDIEDALIRAEQTEFATGGFS
ncbi:hypothetical protein ACSBM8_03665 [Sphingomonas sp. ASY06-1R]